MGGSEVSRSIRIQKSRLFVSYDLDLDPMTLLYLSILKVYLHTRNNKIKLDGDDDFKVKLEHYRLWRQKGRRWC